MDNEKSMRIHTIEVTNNYTNFFAKFKEEIREAKYELDVESIHEIYEEIANLILSEPVGSDYSNLIETIAIYVSRDYDNEENEYGPLYEATYATNDPIYQLYIRMKHFGNGRFYGVGYDNITLSVEFLDTGEVNLIYETTRPLYNPSVFSGHDISYPEKTMCLEEEFTLFKPMFKRFLGANNSMLSTDLSDGDFVLLFVGFIELLITYTIDNEINRNEEVPMHLNTLLNEVTPLIDPHDTELFGKFFLEEKGFVTSMDKLLSKRLCDKYDLSSWGMIGDKIMIGLSTR